MRDAVQEFMAFNLEYARRSAELMRLKVARMSESAFAFFRGTFHLYARDVIVPDLVAFPLLSDGGGEMEVVGDVHSENYGTYKAEDGKIHYDIDDFDETTTGRFDWDVCRFAINTLLASQQRKDTLEAQASVTLAGLASYLQTILGGLKKGKYHDLDISERNPSDAEPIAQLIQRKSDVKRPKFIDEITEDKNGKRSIRRVLQKYYNLTEAERSQATRLVADYRSRLKNAPDKKNFFDIHDICGRISGIGSMGRYRYVVLISGKGHDEKKNILLEFKEARPSSLDIYRQRNASPEALIARAERVIANQRAAQAASNQFLGHAIDGPISFQVREISPHAERIDCTKLKAGAFVDVIKVQAAILARAHVRESARLEGPINPLAQIGDVDRFRQRVLAVALGYAEIAQRDYARFVGARSDLDSVEQWAK